MNKRLLFSLMSILAVFSMLLASCVPAPAPTEAPAPAATEAPAAPAATEAPKPAFKACQVTDTGGIDDKSFNATAWKGVEDAMNELGIEGKYLESQQQTDYEKNINAFIDERLRHHHHRRLPAGRRYQGRCREEPRSEVLHRGLRLRSHHPQRPGTGLQHRPGWLPGWLCSRWRVPRPARSAPLAASRSRPSPSSWMASLWASRPTTSKHGTNVEVLGWDPIAQDRSVHRQLREHR